MRSGDLPDDGMPRAVGDGSVAWWIKVLVLAVVAALCLAFAGLVWALAL